MTTGRDYRWLFTRQTLIFCVLFVLAVVSETAIEEDEDEARLLFEDGMESLKQGDVEDALRAFDAAVAKDNYRNIEWQRTRISTARQLRQMAKSLNWTHSVSISLPSGQILVEWSHGAFLRDIIHPILKTYHLYAEWEWILQKEFLKYEENSEFPWVRAPFRMPESLKDRYTLNGKIPVEEAYVDEGVEVFYESFTQGHVENFMKIAREKEPGPHYRKTDLDLHEILEKRREMLEIGGKRVYVGGSITPWYESVMLSHGAREVVTVEYNELRWNHPQLKTFTPAQFEKMRERGESEAEPFDIALSISSFEHDGLGRYGDPLDPEGDLRAMFEMSKTVKKDGIFILSVPVGADLLAFNCHRVYGKQRLPLLLQNWTILHNGFEKEDWGKGGKLSEDLRPNLNSDQPVFVLRNRKPEKPHVF